MGGVPTPVGWPQQTAVPSVFSAQVWEPPALIALYVPGGALASPKSFEPQHTIVESVRMAQVWLYPVSTARAP